MALTTLLFTAAALHALILAAALWRRQVNRTANRVLATWLVVVSIDLIVRMQPVAMADGWVLRAYAVARYLPLVHASLFYLYVRKLTLSEPMRSTDALYFLGLAIAMIATIDWWLLHPADLRELLIGPGSLRRMALDWLILLHGIGFVLAGVRLAFDFHRRAEARAGSPDQIPVRWLRLISIWQCVIWLAVALVILVPFSSYPFAFRGDLLIYGCVALWVFAAGYAMLAEPHVSPQPSLRDQATKQQLVDATQAARRQEVLRRVENLMHAERMYSQPALTIAEVAKRSGYPEYLVSEALNQELGLSFCRYISQFRIDAACKQLAQPGDQTILDIAYAVGFTSKSTFNTSFRKQTGQTPSAYRAAAKAQSAQD